jgi:spermidine/putrescine transport system substrate-binding protein
MKKMSLWGLCALWCMGMLVGCAPAQPQPTPTSQAVTLTLMHFEGGFPQTLLDRYTEQTGVQFQYAYILNYEEAEERIYNGEVADIAWLTNGNLARLLNERKLATIDYANIPNRRYINPSFRDLAFDPGGARHVPWSWGTTGILYRRDLLETAPRFWPDLWALGEGRAGVFNDPRTMFGVALRALGYSANSSNPEQIDEAAAFLEERWGQQVMVDEVIDPYTAAYALADGTLSIALGWAYDARTAADLNPEVLYVLPEDGSLLWLELMVIPRTSTHQAEAEAFINFLLDPQNAAVFTNEFFYATVIDGVTPYVNEALRGDPNIFPTAEMLAGSELMLPFQPQIDAQFKAHWRRLSSASSDSEAQP